MFNNCRRNCIFAHCMSTTFKFPEKGTLKIQFQSTPAGTTLRHHNSSRVLTRQHLIQLGSLRCTSTHRPASAWQSSSSIRGWAAEQPNDDEDLSGVSIIWQTALSVHPFVFPLLARICRRSRCSSIVPSVESGDATTKFVCTHNHCPPEDELVHPRERDRTLNDSSKEHKICALGAGTPPPTAAITTKPHAISDKLVERRYVRTYLLLNCAAEQCNNVSSWDPLSRRRHRHY